MNYFIALAKMMDQWAKMSKNGFQYEGSGAAGVGQYERVNFTLVAKQGDSKMNFCDSKLCTVVK